MTDCGSRNRWRVFAARAGRERLPELPCVRGGRGARSFTVSAEVVEPVNLPQKLIKNIPVRSRLLQPFELPEPRLY